MPDASSDPSGMPGEGEGDSDGDTPSNSDCGDTGALPGGVGGMGQDGECIGGGGGASSSAAESGGGSSGGGASGGGADAGGGEAGGGASGGGMESGGMQSGGGASGDGIEGTGGAGGIGEVPGESAAERAERLERVFEQSMGDFDEVLLEEQQEVASVGRNTEGFGSGSGGGGGGVDLGEQAGGGSGSSVAVVNDAMAPRESPVAGMSQEEVRERTPEDVPMTADDDIIARQLREAALAEEDPELRERLWDEYRKYKGL